MVDLCAGAGGKTLALAALMENRGQIYATDLDKRRLAPIHKRLERAGVRNTQVHTPHGKEDLLAERHGQADLVLIDAPCTGTGTWRRNPDAKWRVRPGALAERAKEQAAVLDRAAPLVRPGGRIVYVTCSVLAEENGDQVRGFVERHPEFAVAAAGRASGPARRARPGFSPGGVHVARRPADDPAADGDGWVFRERADPRRPVAWPTHHPHGEGPLDHLMVRSARERASRTMSAVADLRIN